MGDVCTESRLFGDAFDAVTVDDHSLNTVLTIFEDWKVWFIGVFSFLDRSGCSWVGYRTI